MDKYSGYRLFVMGRNYWMSHRANSEIRRYRYEVYLSPIDRRRRATVIYATDDATELRVWLDCSGLCIRPRVDVDLNRKLCFQYMYVAEKFEGEEIAEARSYLRLYEK